MLLSPLPVRAQGRVVVLRKEQLVGNETLVPFSVGDLRIFAGETRTLDDVAGAQYDGAWPATMRDGDRVLTPNTAVVSGNFFTTLGMRAALGRALAEGDDVVGGQAIVISYSLWRRAFGGDSTVIGRVIHSAGRGNAFRIVGVMPRGFAFPGKAEVWVPTLTVMPGAPSTEGQWPYNLVGRMRAGVSADKSLVSLGTSKDLARMTNDHDDDADWLRRHLYVGSTPQALGSVVQEPKNCFSRSKWVCCSRNKSASSS